MGFTVVYDPDYRDRRNLIGQVPLDRWPGKTGKNGGGYQYAFTGRTVLASPTLPPEHGINMAPRKEDFLQTIRQIIDLQEKVGRTGELVLG